MATKCLPQIFLIFAWWLSYGLSKSKKRGTMVTKLWNILNFNSPQTKIKNFEASFCRFALLLSFCENLFRLVRLVKKLNSPKRGAFFQHFCVSNVITTAHAHKSGVIFHILPRPFEQKRGKKLRPKMTEIASRGGSCLKPSCLNEYSLFLLSVLIERLQVTGFYLDFKSNGKLGWRIMFAGNHPHVTAVYLHSEQMTRRRQNFRHKYRYTRWSEPFIPPEDNSYTINGVFEEEPLAPGQYMLLVVSLSQGLVNYTSFYYDGKCLHSSEQVIH